MRDHRLSFWMFFAILGVATLAPLWVGPHLPMVDLPQHAAQLSIQLHWNDPAAGYPSIYQVNPWLAHRLAYALVLGLAQLFPLVTAIKLVLGASLIAVPVVVRRILIDLGGDPWWSLAAFPVGFSFAFYFGFFNFVVTTPLAWLTIWLVYRYVERPGWGRAGAIAFGVHLLFLGHLLFMGFCGLVGGGVVLLGCRAWRDRWRGLAALASVVPLVGAWFWTNLRLGAETSAPVPTSWNLSLSRLWHLPGELLGMPEIRDAAIVGLVLLLTPWLTGGTWSRNPSRWIPLAVGAVFYGLGPASIFDTALLYHRFAAAIIPGLVIAFDRGPSDLSRVRRLAMPVVIVLWMASLTPRFFTFNQEAAGLDDLLEHMEPGRRALSLMVHPRTPTVPEAPFLHFGMWYQVHKHGVVDFSFAEFFANRYRYRPEHTPSLPLNFEWNPVTFRWLLHGGDRYRYFLFRVTDPRFFERWNPFQGAPFPVDLVARSGDWWLFEPQPIPRSSALERERE